MCTEENNNSETKERLYSRQNPSMTFQHNKIVSYCLARWWTASQPALSSFSEGVWVEVRSANLKPQGYLNQTGGRGLTVIQGQCGHLMEVSWCQTNCGAPWAQFPVLLGVASMAFPQPPASRCWVQMSLQGSCTGASRLIFGAPGSHLLCTKGGESQPTGNNNGHLSAQGSTAPETVLRRPPAAVLWGCSQGWACTTGHKADTRANRPCWGLCGFHLSKTFPWTSSSPCSCCRGLPGTAGDCHPARHRATRRQGGSVFLLRSQMLAARQS